MRKLQHLCVRAGGGRRRTWRAGVAVGLLTATLVMGGGTVLQHAGADTPHPLCGALQAIEIDGTAQCIHGDDAHLQPAYAQAEDAAANTGHTLTCPALTTGNAVQVLWVRTATGDVLDSGLQRKINGWTAAAQGVFDESASAHGASVARLPRVLTDDSCRNATVDEVVLRPAAMSDFATMISDLRDRGYKDRDRVYLIFADSREYCGIATLYRDDDPDPSENASATRPASGYARVDLRCVNYAEAHELAHTFGAVQNTSPNSTQNGHCNDGYDVMCYSDGSHDSRYRTSSCSRTWKVLLDCGRDDYYDPTNPTSGHLADHWNIADSTFLFDAPVGATAAGGRAAQPDFAHLTADLTGDGSDDVIAFDSNDGSWRIIDESSTGGVVAPTGHFATADGWQTHLTQRSVSRYTLLGGQTTPTDSVLSYHPSNGTWWRTTLESGRLDVSRWGQYATADGWLIHLTGDFDGDGIDQVASYHPRNGTWWVTGNEDATVTRWATFRTRAGWSNHIVGDIDGDGLDDILVYHEATGRWWAARSTGEGFELVRYSEYGTRAGWQDHVLADVDADGADDLLSYHPSNGTWWRTASSGDAASLWAKFKTRTGWTHRVVDGAAGDVIASYHDRAGTWWHTGSAAGTQQRVGQFDTADGWLTHIALGDGRTASVHPSNWSVWSMDTTGASDLLGTYH